MDQPLIDNTSGKPVIGGIMHSPPGVKDIFVINAHQANLFTCI